MSRLGKSSLASPGFSLLEMLIAVAVLAIGSLSVITMHRFAVKQNLSSHAVQTAVALAGQLLEETRALNYTDSRFATTAGYVAPPSTLSPTSPLNASGQAATEGYSRTWQITDGPGSNRKTIDVKVTWAQAAQQIVLSTIKAK